MKMLTLALTLSSVPLLAMQTGSQPASTASDKAMNAKAIAALYTEDAVEMPPNAPSVKGRAAIQQMYEKNFKEAKTGNFAVTHVDSRSSGDVGYDVGTYRQTITPTGGTEMKDTGKYIVVLKRVGGSWKVAHAIYNSDLPPPPSK